jgi:uncharacterized membrane protein
MTTTTRYQTDLSVRQIEDWAALSTGALLLLFGAATRGRVGAAAAVASVPLLYRGLTGEWPLGDGDGADTREALGGDGGVRVQEAIRLEVPIEEAYRFWRRLENLPRFMNYLESVTAQGQSGRSHWVARGPGDVRVEWDAEIINEVPNQVLGWRSLPGSDVVTAGSVNFDRVRGGRATQLTVNLQYAPPAGRAGAGLAWLFGRAPSQTIREDLRRLKQLLEAGELPQATGEPAPATPEGSR